MTSILEVRDLYVSYQSRAGASTEALRGVSFDLKPGVMLGVLGESGSGKSTLATSLLRLLPSNGKITKSAIRFVLFVPIGYGREVQQIENADLI